MNLRTPSATKVLGALSLLLVTGSGWMFAVGPETATLDEVRAQIENARSQNQLLTAQLVTLRKQQENLDQTRATARAVAERFPATADQPGLFRAVTAAATDAGIGAKDVTALTPTPPTIGAVDPAGGVQLSTDASSAELARQTVTVSVEGSYDETARLIENLEQMPRAYLVTSVTLGASAEGSAFTTTITGEMFVMPPVKDPGQLPEAAGAER
jgi:Tfp pilus assembly protein PilO